MVIFGTPLFLAQNKAPQLLISGDVAERRSYRADELRRDFGQEIREIDFTEKGVPGRAHAFPLASLVAASHPRTDPLRKNAEYSLAVVAIGADGYSAVFSAAELSKGLGRGDVWVALDWNGAELPGNDAPMRLIVTDDAKPSRWVHGVRTLRVVNLAPKGHGPAPERHP